MPRAWPRVSIVVATYKGERLLPSCLASVQGLDYPKGRLETIVVDNGSSDGTMRLLKSRYPWVQALRNDENNYCRANNMGMRASTGSYVAFLNDDATVGRAWLRGLVSLAESDPRVGGAAGKNLFPDGRINGVGHEMLPDFRVRDRGFGERDAGQYDGVCEAQSISLCAALFRRASLIDAGPLDEDFVLYYEDVDLCRRLRRKGWRLMLHPGCVARHRWKATSGRLGVDLFFGSRGRLLFLAKHFPEELPRRVLDPDFFKRHDFRRKREAYLLAVLPGVLRKLSLSAPRPRARRVGASVLSRLEGALAPESLELLRRRWEAMLGDRRVRVGIYDHALHFAGGGQKYVLSMAKVLERRFDVEYLCNYPVTARQLSRWHGLRVRFPIRVVRLPFYADRGLPAVNPSLAKDPKENPFTPVSLESARYDIFVNANMLTRVRPLSPLSVLVCHFPDHAREEAWHAREYGVVVNNSRFCTRWLRRLWGMHPDLTLTPPIAMRPLRAGKKDIILSVARFEVSGSKKQREMVAAFARLCRRHPEAARRWRLVLCGGSVPGENCLRETAAQHVLEGPGLPIEIRTNVSTSSLRRLYASAKVFWHICGLGQRDPKLIEHFGMTTVEAMRSSCVPVVFDGGGQREIVEHGESGFLIRSLKGLREATWALMRRPRLLRRMARAARLRSGAFPASAFKKGVIDLFRRLEAEYKDPARPSVARIAAGRLKNL
jgi:GT2 family glycosyltransferase